MKHRALSWNIWESHNHLTPGLRLPQQVNLDDDVLEIVKNIRWSDLGWKEIGDDGHSVIWLELKLPVDLGIEQGVIVDIQLIHKTFYQIHISLAESLRGIGLGTKIYRSLIEWAGHLYSGKGRRHNPIINKVWKGLENEPGVTCLDDNLASICISDNNPDKEELIRVFNGL